MGALPALRRGRLRADRDDCPGIATLAVLARAAVSLSMVLRLAC
jgi:hypothetical protein